MNQMIAAPSEPATNIQRQPLTPYGAIGTSSAPEKSGRRDAQEPERVRPRGVAAAESRRQQLAQVGVDQRQLRPDADAREEARRDEHRRVDAERPERA